jgi:transitional endoplasmic reticulum ATPase
MAFISIIADDVELCVSDVCDASIQSLFAQCSDSIRMRSLYATLLHGTIVSVPEIVQIDWLGHTIPLQVIKCHASTSTETGTCGPMMIDAKQTLVRIYPSSSCPYPNATTTKPHTVVVPDWDHTAFFSSWMQRCHTTCPGMHAPITAILERIQTEVERIHRPQHDDIFAMVATNTCFIIDGAPGTGKTHLMNAVADSAKVFVERIASFELFRKFQGEGEQILSGLFQRAHMHAKLQAQCGSAPLSFVLLDDLDAICPGDIGASGDDQTGIVSPNVDVERRLLAHLAGLIDSSQQLHSHPESIPTHTIVIATTNRLRHIPSLLKRNGRLECSIHLSAPGIGDRAEMLTSLLMPVSCKNKDELITHTASKTSGFVAADLDNLVRESCSLAFRLATDDQATTAVDHRHVDIVLESGVVQPSALAAFDRPGSNTASLDSFGGIDDVIKQLRAFVVQPFLRPAGYVRLGIRPATGVLLYGESGTGKTSLAVACAMESAAQVIRIQAPDIVSKLVGESERHIRELFERARQSAPCIILIDQIEVIAPHRGNDTSSERTFDRILSCLLTEMDGLRTQPAAISAAATAATSVDSMQSCVMVIATTQDRKQLDEAILRPGRLDHHIQVGCPDEKGILSILQHCVHDMPIDESVDLHDIASSLCHGFKGAEIVALVREAAMAALRRSLHATITVADFQSASSIVTSAAGAPYCEPGPGPGSRLLD